MPSERIKLSSGIQLEVDHTERPGAPLVVLIPGAGAPLEFWPAAFCRALSESGYSTLRYCHRDTGLSDHFDAPYPIDALLDDLWALLKQINGETPVHLVGHSMGGYMGLLAMTGHPERLASVAAISSGPSATPARYAELGMSLPAPETWQILMENAPTGQFEQDLAGWMKSWRFLNGSCAFDENRARAYTEALYRGDPRNAQVATHHIHAMGTLPNDLPEKLARSQTPLCVLHGEEDPLVPFDHGKALASVARASSFFPLKKAGHMFFNAETWDHILRALRGHLQTSEK
ncbi:MAG: hydrolase [Puniceicoccaceae bacterium 5H]|nr:MAG: hydrolase [Puniceicoccaceae bacterium 5H]